MEHGKPLTKYMGNSFWRDWKAAVTGHGEQVGLAIRGGSSQVQLVLRGTPRWRLACTTCGPSSLTCEQRPPVTKPISGHTWCYLWGGRLQASRTASHTGGKHLTLFVFFFYERKLLRKISLTIKGTAND